MEASARSQAEDKRAASFAHQRCLVECGAHRYDYLAESPMVYEVDDHGEEWRALEGVDHCGRTSASTACRPSCGHQPLL